MTPPVQSLVRTTPALRRGALISITLGLLAIPLPGQWQQITMPSLREAASAFPAPPPDYGMLLWWNWGGAVTEESIIHDLDDIQARGVQGVLIGASYGVNPKYLSPEWFERIRFVVAQARRRGMRVWLADEGSYPSGFAGGKFNTDHPELRMQAVVVGERFDVAAGQEVSRKLPQETLGALAVNRAENRSLVLDTSSGALRWRAPAGQWQVLLIQHQFRTAPTRYVNNPRPVKDTTYSLCDYLDPRAIREFLADVHEQYRKHIGSEFGRTVVGFFGDEPDYPAIPWTPALLAEFERRKGYDVRPYLPLFFAPQLSEEARRAKADYWDVWSDLFRDTFFRMQADWCTRNNLAYVVHLNHEDMMMSLVRSEGDFFKDMRYVTVPAIDTIWRQIWMDRVADFPKLASSAAHLFGRPRSFTESYAIYGRGLSLEQAKWVMDHQLVRGINLVLAGLFRSSYRSPAASAPAAGQPGGQYPRLPNPQWEQFPVLARYSNRASYLLSIGRPAARIALYHPTSSMWLGDEQANQSTLEIARQLLERQRDFDFIDEQALSSVLPLERGVLRNLSGQAYRAVIVPSCTVISRAALLRLRAFAQAGGRVVFLGRTPSLVVEKTFLKAAGPPDLGWAVREPSGEFTPRVMAALPRPDVALDRPCPPVKYLHRRWRDADLYFLFNESAERQSRKLTLAGRGRAQVWDAESGRIRALTGASLPNGTVSLPLELEPYQTQFLVVGPVPSGVEPPEPALGPPETVLELSGDWTVELGGRGMATVLKPWAELGFPAYSGAARYRKEFTLPRERLAGTRRLFLECGELRYSGRAWLNGVDLGNRAWRPFRWEITKALKPGANVIEIEVRNTPAAAFAGDPARLRELEQQAATQGGYLATSLPFDKEMLLSGLLGPVRILAMGGASKGR